MKTNGLKWQFIILLPRGNSHLIEQLRNTLVIFGASSHLGKDFRHLTSPETFKLLFLLSGQFIVLLIVHIINNLFFNSFLTDKKIFRLNEREQICSLIISNSLKFFALSLLSAKKYIVLQITHVYCGDAYTASNF